MKRKKDGRPNSIEEISIYFFGKGHVKMMSMVFVKSPYSIDIFTCKLMELH
jgi:hypothetical protein